MKKKLKRNKITKKLASSTPPAKALTEKQQASGQFRLRQAIKASTNRGLCNLKTNKTVLTQTVIRAFLVGEKNAHHRPCNRATNKPNTKSGSWSKSELPKAKAIFTIFPDEKKVTTTRQPKNRATINQMA